MRAAPPIVTAQSSSLVASLLATFQNVVTASSALTQDLTPPAPYDRNQPHAAPRRRPQIGSFPISSPSRRLLPSTPFSMFPATSYLPFALLSLLFSPAWAAIPALPSPAALTSYNPTLQVSWKNAESDSHGAFQ